jgi:PKD repeat protein
LVLSDGDVDNNTVISNSEFKGGSRSISLGGVDVNQLEAGSRITGNTFEGFFTGAILLFNQINPTVSENTIVGETGNFNAPFFIYLNGTKLGATVNANYIYANEYGFGINLDNANGASSTPIVVSNNILNFKNNDATGTQFALFTQNGTSEANIVNNSVLIKSELGTNAAVRLGGTGNNFWNNNIVSEGAAYAVLATNANTVAASNFNNLFSPVGNFSAVGSTNFADAAAWNAATGLDGNSVSVDPEFADSLLTSCAPELDNAAFPLPFVSTDFVGNVRSTSTPDIGAYEFLASNNLGLQEAYSFCPENIQPIGVDAQTGVTYSWNPGNSTESTTIPSGAGTYTLTATSACGSFSQSTEVELLPLPNASFTFTTYFLTAVFTNTSTGGTSYLWNFGDGNTSTEVNPTHLYDATGTFDVTLTVFNECGSVVSSDKVTTATVGIEDMDANSFNVYPNPSNGVFNINLDVNGISDLLIDVIDLSGRVIYSQFIANAVEASILTINIEGVKPGVYNVRLNSADFNVVRKLIIK